MISPRAGEVAEKVLYSLCLDTKNPHLVTQVAGRIELALTAQALESRNAALREAALALNHEPRFMSKHHVVKIILALIKE